MKLRVEFEMRCQFPQPTPMIRVLGTHFTRASDIIVPDHLTTTPSVPITLYRDGFGNWCSRIVAPAGPMRLAADGVVRDSGQPDPVFASACQHAVEDLPADTAGLPARQPLLRDRPTFGNSMEAVRDAAGTPSIRATMCRGSGASDHSDVRAKHTGQLQGMDRGGG